MYVHNSCLNVNQGGYLASSSWNPLPSAECLVRGNSEQIIHQLKQLGPISLMDWGVRICEISLLSSYSASSQIAAIEAILGSLKPSAAFEIGLNLLISRRDAFEKILTVYSESDLVESKFKVVFNLLVKNNSDLIEPLLKEMIEKDMASINAFISQLQEDSFPLIASSLLLVLGPSFGVEIGNLLLQLQDHSFCEVFIEEWLRGCRWDCYKQVVSSLVIQQQIHPVTSYRWLSMILSKSSSFNSPQYHETFIDYLSKCCTDTQNGCLLAAVPPNLQKIVIQKYAPFPVASAHLLNRAFELRNEHAFKKECIEILTQHPKTKTLAWKKDFFATFEKNSNAAYLLLTFNNQYTNKPNGSCFSFFRFLESLTPDIQAPIFKNMSLLDPLEMRVLINDLQSIHRLDLMLNEFPIYLPSQENKYKFKYVFYCLDLELKKLSVTGQSDKKIPYWEDVPSIFILFGLYHKDFNSVILQSFFYMNDDQQKLVISHLCAAKDLDSLDKLLAYDFDAKKIYTWMSSETLSKYYQIRIDELKKKTVEFHTRYTKYEKQIEPYLKDLEQVNQPSEELFSYLNDELIVLINYFKCVETPFYHRPFNYLCKNTEGDLNAQEIVFKKAVEVVKDLQLKLISRKFGATINRLEAMFSSEQVEEGFPEHFLALLTPYVQNVLNIQDNVLEGLKAFGISTENDLKILGYHPEKEDLLQRICNYVLDNIPRETSQTLANECQDRWHRIFLKQEETFDVACEKFIQETTLLSQPHDVVLEVASSLLRHMKQLVEFPGIAIHREFLNQCEKCLTDKKNDDLVIKKTCKNLLILFMESYHSHIIPQIIRYCNQPSFQQSWDRLKAEGYETLQSLDERKDVQGENFPFNMKKVMKNFSEKQTVYV